MRISEIREIQIENKYMTDQKTDIERLIRLKRYEQPPEGYFDDFLVEFQSRQRSEMLKSSAHGLFFERLGTYFSGFSKRQWVYAGSAAYAAVTIGFFLIAGSGNQESQQSQPVAQGLASVVPVNVGAADEKHTLWDKPATILVEDNQIANRRQSMSVMDAEWDASILPTAGHGENIQFRPQKNKEGKAPPVTPPFGTEL
ncbi:MAG: hypothetical protein ACI9R3_000809 [Verrucomicrobiales bacterium]|jgi:hypothetical protein